VSDDWAATDDREGDGPLRDEHGRVRQGPERHKVMYGSLGGDVTDRIVLWIACPS
jgi:hypothetical protein